MPDDVWLIVRALEAAGPMTAADLAGAVDASDWEAQRFERALAMAVADGRVHRAAGGRIAASGRA